MLWFLKLLLLGDTTTQTFSCIYILQQTNCQSQVQRYEKNGEFSLVIISIMYGICCVFCDIFLFIYQRVCQQESLLGVVDFESKTELSNNFLSEYIYTFFLFTQIDVYQINITFSVWLILHIVFINVIQNC